MSDNPIRLPQFLKTVDTLIKKMTKEELEAFVYEMARTLPELQRGLFEAKLKAAPNDLAGSGNIGNGPAGKIAKAKKEKRETEEKTLLREIQDILKKLEKIQAGEDRLDSEYNENWDDWYDSMDDEFVFSDPHDILEGVRQAIQMVHTCIDREFMDVCVMKLVEQISQLEVSVSGDYLDGDGSPLSISDLYLYDLLKGDYDRLIKECLYLNYIGSDPEDQALRLYDMIESMEDSGQVRIESLMQMGNGELPGFDVFLRRWITFLAEQTGGRAGRLLNEAQSLLSDDAAMLENARMYAKKHPSLYLQYLEVNESRRESGILDQADTNQKEDAKIMLAIGLEALRKIPTDYKIRSRIALCTADYANRLADVETAEQCWLEAFRSDSSVVNYMRLRFEVQDWKHYQTTAYMIIEDQFQKSKQKAVEFVAGECQRNELSLYDYCILMFFEQGFEKMRKTGMNTRSALGWSATFMKQGISLMLLLLYRGDNVQKGLQEMERSVIANCQFQAKEYAQGLELEEGDSHQLFFLLFSDWKKQVALPEAEQKQWLKRIDTWLAKRVEGIMQENRRNYYGECAAFLAALCEVLQSCGEQGVKEKYYERYRALYPRRRLFLEAMRSYGMK